jgi:hypothetical protein
MQDAKGSRPWKAIVSQPVPHGWRPGPPDFVGVGVQKAGTTWWFQVIAQHPAFRHAPSRRAYPVKELHFFDRFWNVPFTTSDAATYYRCFPRPAGAFVGEWTPRYMYDYWTPGLLQVAAPDVRLLVLLRDPVERYSSGLTLQASGSRFSGRQAAEEAFHRGLYHQQLRGLLEHFDRRRILVLQLERCRQSPVQEWERTLAFLGLERTRRPPAKLGEIVNQTMTSKLPLQLPLHEALVAAYRQDARRLARAFPEVDLDLWSSLRA